MRFPVSFVYLFTQQYLDIEHVFFASKGHLDTISALESSYSFCHWNQLSLSVHKQLQNLSRHNDYSDPRDFPFLQIQVCCDIVVEILLQVGG